MNSTDAMEWYDVMSLTCALGFARRKTNKKDGLSVEIHEVKEQSSFAIFRVYVSVHDNFDLVS